MTEPELVGDIKKSSGSYKSILAFAITGETPVSIARLVLTDGRTVERRSPSRKPEQIDRGVRPSR